MWPPDVGSLHFCGAAVRAGAALQCCRMLRKRHTRTGQHQHNVLHGRQPLGNGRQVWVWHLGRRRAGGLVGAAGTGRRLARLLALRARAVCGAQKKRSRCREAGGPVSERSKLAAAAAAGRQRGNSRPPSPDRPDRCCECVGAGAGPHARARRPGGLLARSWLPGARWAWLQSILGPILEGMQSATGAKEAQGPSPCGT